MQSFENEYIKMEVRDGILYSNHIAQKIITLEEAKFLLEEKFEKIGDEPYPILVDARNGKGATREAQEYVLRKDEEIGTPAIAIIVDSFVSRLFATVLLTLVKTKIKIKVFNQKKAAIHWLKKYVSEEILA